MHFLWPGPGGFYNYQPNEGYDEQGYDWDWNEWNQAENQEDAAEPQQDSTSAGDLRASVTKLVLDQMRTFAKEEDLEAKESTILNAGAITVLSTQGNPFKVEMWKPDSKLIPKVLLDGGASHNVY